MKTPKPYSTDYPFYLPRSWYWFDIAVYGKHLPKIGNLPSDVYARLKGGVECGGRNYTSEAEAIADYEQAIRPTLGPDNVAKENEK